MKLITCLFFICGLQYCSAQGTDTTARLAAAYFKELKLAVQDQHIWKEPVYGPMLLVFPESHLAYANEPDSAGILKPVDGVYKGSLPSSMIIGNTAVEWGGKTWSMVMWPPPADRDARLNLLAHESFHRIQKRMGLPMRSPTVDFLGTMQGRIYFLLELQALKAALAQPTDNRGIDLGNALLFREKLHQLFPKTFETERLLEMNEGLAEYTGVMLGRPAATIPAHLDRIIDSAENQKSLIRSAAYITGPVYGYLLFQKAPDWTLKIDSNADFAELLSAYYHIKRVNAVSDEELQKAQKLYPYDAIVAAEGLKEKKRLQMAKYYTELFTQKTVLTLTLHQMNVGFDPRNLFDLGDYGTVYPTAQVKDDWGQLEVSGNGMLMKNWHVVTLPAAGIQAAGDTLKGDGWLLHLNIGWKLVKKDEYHYLLEHL